MKPEVQELLNQQRELQKQLARIQNKITTIQKNCPHEDVQNIPGPEAGKTNPICQDCDAWM